MTHRERFTKTLLCEPIGGQVPTFELAFFLTMEAFGKVHPSHRFYEQWDQMSTKERHLHIADMADTYIETAKRYGHSAILLHPNPISLEDTHCLLETVREKSGDEYFLLLNGDTTLSIPNGDDMMSFSVDMYENPEKLHEKSKRKMEQRLTRAAKLHQKGHLFDGLALCSDYCFNTNPFFSGEQFDEFIVPYLKEGINEYRSMGFYTIKHTDGNINPIVRKIAACKPDALHSLDPQGGVSIPEIRAAIGNDICLVGNVNCGLLQTGSDEECKADVLRSLREGMKAERGYVFSTSNCAYTGLSLKRYEMMNNIWREHGYYK